MKNCYGTICPDLAQFRFGKEVAGEVFRLRINTLGPGHRDRGLETDLNPWQNCQQCDRFRSCSDLSNAKLAMQQAVAVI